MFSVSGSLSDPDPELDSELELDSLPLELESLLSPPAAFPDGPWPTGGPGGLASAPWSFRFRLCFLLSPPIFS